MVGYPGGYRHALGLHAAQGSAGDHKDLFEGTFETGQEVTQACLGCHEEAAQQVIHTAHWRWQSEPVMMEGRDEPVSVGKKNTINNFCIGIQGNWASCTACHAGYGWEDETFDFEETANVDCLVCHDSSGGYKKGKKGLPAEGVDLLASAKSVGCPPGKIVAAVIFVAAVVTRSNTAIWTRACIIPAKISMCTWGAYDFQCVDCHQTEDHVIGGRSISSASTMKTRLPAPTAISRNCTQTAGSTHIPTRWPARPATSRRWPSNRPPRHTGTGPGRRRGARRKTLTST